ncbi:PqqD family protein [bacterium]|nr:PqqD family protein [Chloroflexi bacterium CFX6]RIL12626.1 MAG: PqqD family protein [bacterium]
MTPTLNHRPVRATTVTTSMVGEEAVLLQPDHGQIKVLNDVGARVWQLADGTRTVRSIVAEICLEYEVEQERAEADTLAFIADLEAKSLLMLEPSAHPGEAASGDP